MKGSLPQTYFDFVYDNSDDPWNYETSEYEKSKYASTINALPKKFYQNALELGCSIGVLTKLLSEKCAFLLSIDVNEKALQTATKRLHNNTAVKFERRFLPDGYPDGKFDLIVMSEVGYYLSLNHLKILKEKIIKSLEVNGDLILVHWLPFVEDYPLTGDEVHNLFAETHVLLKHVSNARYEKYRLDVYTKISD